MVLSGVAAKASGNKVVGGVVAAFGYWSDVIQGRRESGQLFFAITAFVAVTFENLDAVFTDVVVINISCGNFWLRFRRCSFRTELTARFDLFGGKHTVQCAIPVRFSFFADRTNGFQSPKSFTNLLFRDRVLNGFGVRRFDESLAKPLAAESDVRASILCDGMPQCVPVECRLIGRQEWLEIVYDFLNDDG